MEAIPNTFTSISFRMASTAFEARIGVFNIAPALLTSRETSEHCLTAASISLLELMSSCTAMTRASVIFDGSRAPAYTFATPEDNSASTYALPKPRFAPVTSATLPVIFMNPPNLPLDLALSQTHSVQMQQPPIGQSLELSGLICSEEWWPMDRVRLMRR